MANGQPAVPPNTADVISSLKAAADAADDAYNAAFIANPGADLKQLYMKKMAALAAWSTAENKALNSDPAVIKAQADLDTATKDIQSKLATLKDISQCMTLLDNLVNLATTVSKFFA